MIFIDYKKFLRNIIYQSHESFTIYLISHLSNFIFISNNTITNNLFLLLLISLFVFIITINIFFSISNNCFLNQYFYISGKKDL